MSASFARCTWPITGCLNAAEGILGPDRVWGAVNDLQTRFLDHHFAHTRGIDLDVVESTVSRSEREIMAWLAKRGFEIQLNPCGPTGFIAASVLDVLLEWLEHSTTADTIIGANHRRYEAVKMKLRAVRFFSASTQLIVQVQTNDPSTQVYMTMLEHPPLDEFEIINLARQFNATKVPSQEQYSGVTFPMIHFEEKRNLDWLIGLYTHNQNGLIMSIDEAIQMNRLRMNHEGVRAQSAAVVTMRSFSPQVPLLIDRPFLFWIQRDGVAEPLYTAWLGYDAWKNPGGLV